MHLVELSDAAVFLQRSSALLLKAEAENNLLLSSAMTLAKSTAGRSPRLNFFIVEDKGKTLCSALNAPERRLLLSTGEEEAAKFMGQELARREAKLKAVLGPSREAVALSESFSAEKGVKLEPRFVQRILRLEKLAERPTAPGLFRVAKEKDLKLLREWSFRFVKESEIDEPKDETEEVVRRYLENRQLFVWEDHAPVAMAGFGGLTPNGARVNMVYTVHEARSRGYAGSLVQGLSRRLLREGGKKFCFLFVDASNVAANKVYERLGYKEVGAFTEFRLPPTVAATNN